MALAVAWMPSSARSAEPAQPPCAACAAIATTAAGAASLAIDPSGTAGIDVVIDGPPAPGDTLERLRAAGARPWIVGSADEAEHLDLRGASGAWIVPPAGSVARIVFAVQTAATALRGRAPELRLGLMLAPQAVDPATAAAVVPYIDAVRVPRDLDVPVPEIAQRFAGLDVWVDAGGGDVLSDTVGAGALRVVLQARDEAPRTVAQVAALSPWLVPGLTPLDELRVTCDGCRASTWLHPDTLHAIALIESDSASPAGTSVLPNTPLLERSLPRALGPVRIEPGGTRVVAIDVDAVDRGPIPIPSLPDAAVVTFDRARRIVVDVAGWRGSDEGVYRATVAVSAVRQLTAEEIVARHQAWRARQAALVRNTIASGTTTLTFEVPGFAGPVTVTAATRIFTRGTLVEMEQRDIRMNGVDMGAGGKAPRLPIIEPERVITPPLAITLGAAYAYRLAGRARADGRDCYVIAFTPHDDGRSAFLGRAWIDAASFALVHLEAVQTNLRGAIVSSRQQDELRPVTVDGREVWVTVRSTIDQIYQAAGLRTPIHRVIDTPQPRVNAPDFDAVRESALRSDAVILRDTARGYQYLVPAPAGEGSTTPRVLAPKAGRRVVTAAFGVIDDPNITTLLPYAGVSYLDFDFLGKGVQLSGFFGGTYGQAAWTVPGVIRPGWQLTGRVFAIAARYNDRAFVDGVEQYDENILQRPAHADASLVIPLAPRVQLRAGYEFDYASFEQNDDTAASFVVPADEIAHGAIIGLDLQHGPWSALAWWAPARRQGWRPWGTPGTADYRPGTEDFQKYGLTVARAWVLSPGSVARIEGTWADGHDLDRFSRYTVDGFENRLRGYPSASLRYDRGLIVRSVATWAPAPRLRLDGFLDYAAVHDPGFGAGLRSYPGIGATAELPLPKRFLISLEWGYGFQARNADGTRGTRVFRVAGVKVF